MDSTRDVKRKQGPDLAEGIHNTNKQTTHSPHVYYLSTMSTPYIPSALSAAPRVWRHPRGRHHHVYSVHRAVRQPHVQRPRPPLLATSARIAGGLERGLRNLRYLQHAA
eukprot:8643748-Pyramimonas_sp.AAC.2